MNIRTISISLLAFFLSCSSLFAAEAASPAMHERLIGATIKNLAKAYVIVADIDKLRKTNVEKLEGMNDDAFKKRYLRIFELFRDLPKNVKKMYGVSEITTRAEAITLVKTWDKAKIRSFIDTLPDKVITKHFKSYLKRRREALNNSSIVQQAHAFWEKIKREIEHPR